MMQIDALSLEYTNILEYGINETSFSFLSIDLSGSLEKRKGTRKKTVNKTFVSMLA